VAGDEGQGRGTEGNDDVAQLADPIAQLQAMDPARLAAALEGEHPRTAAIVLRCLDGAKAGQVLSHLGPELGREVFGQLTKAAPAHSIVDRVAKAVANKALQIDAEEIVKDSAKRFRQMADMLRAMDRKARAEIMQALEKQDAETAALVQAEIYRFDDIECLSDRSVQKLLAEVDMQTLATALFGVSDKTKEKVFRNLSRRARETLEEELSFLQSLTEDQVTEARKKITEAMRLVDQAGELVMEN